MTECNIVIYYCDSCAPDVFEQNIQYFKCMEEVEKIINSSYLTTLRIVNRCANCNESCANYIFKDFIDKQTHNNDLIFKNFNYMQDFGVYYYASDQDISGFTGSWNAKHFNNYCTGISKQQLLEKIKIGSIIFTKVLQDNLKNDLKSRYIVKKIREGDEHTAEMYILEAHPVTKPALKI
jgi:hypothetical protein